MRKRFRVEPRLFRAPLVVLQVLETVGWTDPQTFETERRDQWRDATPEDLFDEIPDDRA